MEGQEEEPGGGAGAEPGWPTGDGYLAPGLGAMLMAFSDLARC